jgi:hypothetical protein
MNTTINYSSLSPKLMKSPTKKSRKNKCMDHSDSIGVFSCTCTTCKKQTLMSFGVLRVRPELKERDKVKPILILLFRYDAKVQNNLLKFLLGVSDGGIGEKTDSKPIAVLWM